MYPGGAGVEQRLLRTPNESSSNLRRNILFYAGTCNARRSSRGSGHAGQVTSIILSTSSLALFKYYFIYRCLDHISRGTLKLENVKHVVLDEGDTMLEMGFQKDVESIIANVKVPDDYSIQLTIFFIYSIACVFV